jgi:glycerol uptake facilitator-like aquaporin
MGGLKIDPRGLFAEYFGTFLLTFGVSMSAGQPLAVGGSLWLGMCITGFRSGAQFNPAVTLSVLVKTLLDGKLDTSTLTTLLLNIPCQIAGGLTAGFLAWAVSDTTFYFKISDDFKLGQAFLSEMLFTMLLCLNVHQAGKAKHGLFLEGGLIAMTLGTCAFTIGHITRNCVNPAVELGLGVSHYADHSSGMTKTWLYILAPICGGTNAALIAKVRRYWEVNPRQSKTLNFEMWTG